MDPDTLLTTTRSVRRKLDLDRPVERDVVDECLRIAGQAPAAGVLADALRWLVVREPETKARLAVPVRAAGTAAQQRYGHLVPARSVASGRHLLDNLERIPVYVLACMQGSPGEDDAARSTFYGSVYPAIWSLQLALRARGLGSSIVNYHLYGHRETVARLLGIPADVEQIALLAIGHTTTATFHSAARRPLGEITHYERWG